MQNSKSSERPVYFVDPTAPSECKWKLGINERTIHAKRIMPQHKKVCDNILEAIGCTPLVKLNKIPKSAGIQCEMYVKCEFMNPAGSIKDRIADRMIEDAEKAGTISPGWTLIEPTGGNSGIGLAMAAAVKGYNCIIVKPDHMSLEKESILKALNAEIVCARDDVAYDHPEHLISVAQRLAQELPNAIVLNQFKSASNPLAHYDGTAPEILWQLDNCVDMIVVGASTGGTITGIARYVKEKLPTCKVVGVDPLGSKIARPAELNSSNVKQFEVEGIGLQFATTIIDYTIIDDWIKTNDFETFAMCRRLIKEEGLLVGGSSGAAMCAALKAAKDLTAAQRCVIIFADGTRNYLTKFVSDSWLEARDLKEVVNPHKYWWWNYMISDLQLPSATFIKSNATFYECVEFFKQHNLTQVAVIDAVNGTFIGVVFQENLFSQIVSDNANMHDLLIKTLVKKPFSLKNTDNLGKLAKALEMESCVVILKNEGKKKIVASIVSKMDIISYLANNCKQTASNGH